MNVTGLVLLTLTRESRDANDSHDRTYKFSVVRCEHVDTYDVISIIEISRERPSEYIVGVFPIFRDTRSSGWHSGPASFSVCAYRTQPSCRRRGGAAQFRPPRHVASRRAAPRRAAPRFPTDRNESHKSRCQIAVARRPFALPSRFRSPLAAAPRARLRRAALRHVLASSRGFPSRC